MELIDLIQSMDLSYIDALHVGAAACISWYVRRKDVPSWFYRFADNCLPESKKSINPAQANEVVSIIEERYGSLNSRAKREFFNNPGNKGYITGEKKPRYEPPDKLL